MTSTPPRVEGMDYTVAERIAAGELADWRDPSGTVTLDNLRRSLAALVAAGGGRPLIIASIELEEDLAAAVDDLGGVADLYLSVNMPGDRRVYLFSGAVRPVAGL